MSLKKTRVLKSCLFALTLLCVGGTSTPSHASRSGKASASKQHKAKTTKAQRRQTRKNKPQRKVAGLRLKSAKAQVLTARVATALRKGDLTMLMTKVKGTRTLALAKFSKGDRAAILEVLNTVGGTIAIEFGALPPAARIAAAKSIFMNGPPVEGASPFVTNPTHPLATMAWNMAASAPSMTISSNRATYRSPGKVVEFTNTGVGVLKVTTASGKVTMERARRNPETRRYEIQVVSE